MRLAKLRIKGFRCFGESVEIEFEDLTAFVGANATGKTAVLMALVRMFGATKQARTLARDDFYCERQREDPGELALTIEAHFDFPELADDAEAEASRAVPECLKHILVDDNNGRACCRIRLSGTWARSTAPEGEVEQRLDWLNSFDDEPPSELIHSMRGVERSLIQAVYIPASRDAVRELRGVSGTILSRTLHHVSWSADIERRLLELSQEMAGQLRSAPQFEELEEKLQEQWIALRGAETGKPQLSVADTDLYALLRRLDASLDATDGGSRSVKLLSEGELSLLYFALVAAALAFESELVENEDEVPVELPVLTIVAVEEPENHLSPHYLGRILRTLRAIESHRNAQVVITSHSASILRRVVPVEVRHFRRGDKHPIVSRLTLPEDPDEAHKFVLSAVQRYPELYFAKLVVFGEGTSEEIVIPRIAGALGVDLDPQFVAVVPLGGRHVNHFWRLLDEIGTPYLTLLDLDTDRAHGGWARLAYVHGELLKLGNSWDEVWGSVSEAEAKQWGDDYGSGEPEFADWVESLENKFDVYFSTPLDLDFMLLRAYPEEYQSLAPAGKGPRVPLVPAARKLRIARATRAVLGADGGTGEGYVGADKLLFPWYSYFFISGSKPAKHAEALAALDDSEILSRCPPVLKRLVERIESLVE